MLEQKRQQLKKYSFPILVVKDYTVNNEVFTAEESKTIYDSRPDFRKDPIFKLTSKNLTSDFILGKANVSQKEAKRRAAIQQNQQVFEMPIHFERKEDYVSKLTELLMTEAESERLRTEMIAQRGISFTFIERLQIYSKLRLQIPKTIQQHIRNHVLISVLLREAGSGKEYIGTGVVKKVEVRRNQQNMSVILQIDCMDPLDRNQRQETPKIKTNYQNTLDFRVRYDFQNIKSQISSIQENLLQPDSKKSQAQKMI